ncbi:hypothetical protein Tco_0100863, partial [Tanacetum coccineum]
MYVFAYGPFKNSFQATIGNLKLPTCLWVIRGGETVSNSVFKHDLCKLVIAKIGAAITNDSTWGTELGEERFKKFANNSGVVGGALSLQPILTSVKSGDQVMGVSVDFGPIKSRIKDLFGGVVGTVMSPDGSTMAS